MSKSKVTMVHEEDMGESAKRPVWHKRIGESIFETWETDWQGWKGFVGIDRGGKWGWAIFHDDFGGMPRKAGAAKNRIDAADLAEEAIRKQVATTAGTQTRRASLGEAHDTEPPPIKPASP